MQEQYTKEQELFIINNYPKFGPKYCAEHLGKNEAAVYAKAKRMGIRKIGRYKHPSMQHVNPELFWDIKTPEVAYFLGYFWADGHIIYKKNKTCHLYRIALEIVSDDANNILPILNKIGKWAIQTRKRGDWKETTTITTNSKDIYEFLLENDYRTKSESEPTKILSKISDSLKPYFWRGYFDGDGSLYVKRKHSSLQFSSTYDYSWKELVKLFNQLKIQNPNIFRQTSKRGHKSSKITLFKKEKIKNFIEYLKLSNYGLTRKTKKMDDFLSILVNHSFT